MGLLIAVEGLDGAGKNTLVSGLLDALHARRRSASTLTFPRYGHSVHADLAAEALRGGHPPLADSWSSMATLFALDRAHAVDELRSVLEVVDVVVLDRYVASNVAYSAARCREDADGPVAQWIEALEFDRLNLPVPDLQVLLDVSTDLAARRAQSRAAADSSRALDVYERDEDLQARTGQVYRSLAESGWRGKWHRHGAGDDLQTLVEQITELPLVGQAGTQHRVEVTR